MKGRLVLALWCSLMSGQVFRLNNPLAKVQDVLHDCNTDKIFGGLDMLATAKSCMFQPHAWSHVIIECCLQSVKRQSFSQVHNILRQNEKKRAQDSHAGGLWFKSWATPVQSAEQQGLAIFFWIPSNCKLEPKMSKGSYDYSGYISSSLPDITTTCLL